MSRKLYREYSLPVGKSMSGMAHAIEHDLEMSYSLKIDYQASSEEITLRCINNTLIKIISTLDVTEKTNLGYPITITLSILNDRKIKVCFFDDSNSFLDGLKALLLFWPIGIWQWMAIDEREGMPATIHRAIKAYFTG